MTGQKRLRIPKELKAVGFDEQWARGFGCDNETLRQLAALVKPDGCQSIAEPSSVLPAIASGRTART